MKKRTKIISALFVLLALVVLPYLAYGKDCEIWKDFCGQEDKITQVIADKSNYIERDSTYCMSDSVVYKKAFDKVVERMKIGKKRAIVSTLKEGFEYCNFLRSELKEYNKETYDYIKNKYLSEIFSCVEPYHSEELNRWFHPVITKKTRSVVMFSEIPKKCILAAVCDLGGCKRNDKSTMDFEIDGYCYAIIFLFAIENDDVVLLHESVIFYD